MTLEESYNKRKKCYNEVVLPKLTSAITEERAKGKGSLLRKRFMRLMEIFQRNPFSSEEEEYQMIGKFGTSRAFNQNIIEAFNEEEQELIINTIAKEYGAFDY